MVRTLFTYRLGRSKPISLELGLQQVAHVYRYTIFLSFHHSTTPVPFFMEVVRGRLKLRQPWVDYSVGLHLYLHNMSVLVLVHVFINMSIRACM